MQILIFKISLLNKKNKKEPVIENGAREKGGRDKKIRKKPSLEEV